MWFLLLSGRWAAAGRLPPADELAEFRTPVQ